MTADEVMSEEVRLGALQQHIEDALKKEGVSTPTAAQFREHLGRVCRAREALRQLCVIDADLGRM